MQQFTDGITYMPSDRRKAREQTTWKT